jgi:hypothetical protein
MGKKFSSNDKMKSAISVWFEAQDVNFSAGGFQYFTVDVEQVCCSDRWIILKNKIKN